MRLAWVLVGVLCVAAVATLDPARFGWSTADVVALVVGVRPWLAAVLAVLALLGGIGAIVGRRRGWRIAPLVALAVVWAVMAGGHAGVLMSRGLDPGTVPGASTEGPDEITVMTLNVHGGFRGVDRLLGLIERTGADVIALPEMAKWFRELLVDRIEDDGVDLQIFDGEASGSQGRGSVLLISAGLGEYREVTTEDEGTVRVEPVDGEGPPVAVVHPRSPQLFSPARMDQWRAELAAIERLVLDMPGGIVLGDLNATVDHEPLRSLTGYVNAATVAGAGGVGTYPSTLPWWLATAIDHVLVDPARLEVVDVAVFDVAGTDHRAVVARFALR